MVDDSGIRYRNKKDAGYLISVLQEKYEVTQYWTGGLYCGITLKLDYNGRQLEISIPGYVKDTLHKLQQPTLTRPQHSPHHWTSSNHGFIVPQMAHPIENSPALNLDEAKNFQKVVETSL